MSVKELLLSRTVKVSNQMKNCLGEEFKLLFAASKSGFTSNQRRKNTAEKSFLPLLVRQIVCLSVTRPIRSPPGLATSTVAGKVRNDLEGDRGWEA